MDIDLELAEGIPDFLTGGLKPSDGLAGRPYPPRKVAILFRLRYADKARNHTFQLAITSCHDPAPRITVARKMPEGDWIQKVLPLHAELPNVRSGVWALAAKLE